MKYFLDTEFHEYYKQTKICGIPIGKAIPTIDLISIGIIDENQRPYYAICKDFNIKDAWFSNQGTKEKPDYWLRENVLEELHHSLYITYLSNGEIFKPVGKTLELREITNFNIKNLKSLINKYGKTKKQIAKEIKTFCKVTKHWSGYGEQNHLVKKPTTNPEFYAYYANYDWVVFCQLFEKMINLPKGFPMYCKDLKQTFDEKANSLTSYELSKLAHTDIVKHNVYSNYDTGVLKTTKVKLLKNALTYPKQKNEHNALDDAKWNKKLYNFLQTL